MDFISDAPVTAALIAALELGFVAWLVLRGRSRDDDGLPLHERLR